MRLRRILSDGWEFVPDCSAPARVGNDDPAPPTAGWRPIRVPGYWQVQFADLARATGPGWYRLSLVAVPAWFEHDTISLRFGAVSYFCQGWLNRGYLGEHEGGSLPFSWTLDGSIHEGSNELLVRVVSPSGDRSRFAEFPFEETLHGKQSWYGPNGGIWQDVVLEARSAIAIESIEVHPDPDAGQIEVRVELVDGAAAPVQLEVVGPNSEIVAAATTGAGDAITIPLDDHVVQWWSPSSPALYTVRARVIGADGVEVDVDEKRFGFRTFMREGGQFLLNGEPFYLRGVLDQDYYDSPGVPTSKQALLGRFTAIKEMGFNTLRCHIKIPDPLYLDAADEVGMVVWCELPTTSRLTVAARERVEQTLAAMIERDRHHPSIVIWTVANESWGYDLVGNAEHRSWLNAMFKTAKALAPDRLIVDNSPCFPNFHVETDIEDFHFYAVIPEMRGRWDEFLDAFARRAEFTFSPNGDASRTGDEPLVVSEFGAWGLPDLSRLGNDEPWWFESGQEWANGAAYVHGSEERFALWHLDKVFGDWNALCVASQRRQFETMRYQIDTMRLRPEIAGFVLTELGDVHWEANGLFDMTGQPRSFTPRLAAVNSDVSLIAHVERPVIWQDDTAPVELTVVNDHHRRDDLVVRCGLTGDADTATLELDGLGPNERRRLEPFTVKGAPSDTPTELRVECSMTSGGGVMASVQPKVLVVPRLGPQLSADQVLVVDDESLAHHLDALGYAVTSRPNDTDLRVMRRLSSDDHDFIQAGGRGLLLADGVDAMGSGFGEFPPVELKRWREALFGGGEWVSAFSWLRRAGRFAELPGDPIMDAFFEGLTPDVVITGIPPARFDYDVMAGVFVGWVHQIAALIARHNPGLGSLTVCTLKLTEEPPEMNPLATWLLHQLVAEAWDPQ